jgi:hypothetical protein
MEDKDLWTTFTKTGSVVDYLNYKGAIGEETVESSDNRDGNDSVRDTNR